MYIGLDLGADVIQKSFPCYKSKMLCVYLEELSQFLYSHVDL